MGFLQEAHDLGLNLSKSDFVQLSSRAFTEEKKKEKEKQVALLFHKNTAFYLFNFGTNKRGRLL